ncbi:hypothetical protein ACC717_38240, partial [Rhizobium ruizarguesonis]
PGDLPFSLERLDDDVSNYLGKAGTDSGLRLKSIKTSRPAAVSLEMARSTRLETKSSMRVA